MLRFTVDKENNAENFWDNAGELVTLITELITAGERMVPPRLEWMRATLETIPGWNDANAPEYAKHPILFYDGE